MGIWKAVSGMKQQITDNIREEINERKADAAAFKISKKKARAEYRREMEQQQIRLAKQKAKADNKGSGILRLAVRAIKDNKQKRIKKQRNNLPPMFR